MALFLSYQPHGWQEPARSDWRRTRSIMQGTDVSAEVRQSTRETRKVRTVAAEELMDSSM